MPDALDRERHVCAPEPAVRAKCLRLGRATSTFVAFGHAVAISTAGAGVSRRPAGRRGLQRHPDPVAPRGSRSPRSPGGSPVRVPAGQERIRGRSVGRTRWPRLGRITAAALIVYFLAAMGLHARAEDRVLRCAPATAMLAWSIAALRAFREEPTSQTVLPAGD